MAGPTLSPGLDRTIRQDFGLAPEVPIDVDTLELFISTRQAAVIAAYADSPGSPPVDVLAEEAKKALAALTQSQPAAVGVAAAAVLAGGVPSFPVSTSSVPWPLPPEPVLSEELQKRIRAFLSLPFDQPISRHHIYQFLERNDGDRESLEALKQYIVRMKVAYSGVLPPALQGLEKEDLADERSLPADGIPTTIKEFAFLIGNQAPGVFYIDGKKFIFLELNSPDEGIGLITVNQSGHLVVGMLKNEGESASALIHLIRQTQLPGNSRYITNSVPQDPYLPTRVQAGQSTGQQTQVVYPITLAIPGRDTPVTVDFNPFLTTGYQDASAGTGEYRVRAVTLTVGGKTYILNRPVAQSASRQAPVPQGNNTEPAVFRTYPFILFRQTEEGLYYHVGDLVAFYSLERQTLSFYDRQTSASIAEGTQDQPINLPLPIMDFRIAGRQFVMSSAGAAGTVGVDLRALFSNIKITRPPTYPGQDPFAGATMGFPLTPEFSRLTGIPYQHTYPIQLIKQGGSQGDDLYRAGPFVIEHTRLKDIIFIYPANPPGRVATEGMSCLKATDTMTVIILKYDSEKGGYFPCEEAFLQNLRGNMKSKLPKLTIVTPSGISIRGSATASTPLIDGEMAVHLSDPMVAALGLNPDAPLTEAVALPPPQGAKAAGPSKGRGVRVGSTPSSPPPSVVPATFSIPQNAKDFNAYISAKGPGTFYVGNKPYIYFEATGATDIGLCLISIEGEGLVFEFLENSPDYRDIIHFIRATPVGESVKGLEDVTDSADDRVRTNLRSHKAQYPASNPRCFFYKSGEREAVFQLGFFPFVPATALSRLNINHYASLDNSAAQPVTFSTEMALGVEQLLSRRVGEDHQPYVLFLPEGDTFKVIDVRKRQVLTTMKAPSPQQATLASGASRSIPQTAAELEAYAQSKGLGSFYIARKPYIYFAAQSGPNIGLFLLSVEGSQVVSTFIPDTEHNKELIQYIRQSRSGISLNSVGKVLAEPKVQGKDTSSTPPDQTTREFTWYSYRKQAGLRGVFTFTPLAGDKRTYYNLDSALPYSLVRQLGLPSIDDVARGQVLVDSTQKESPASFVTFVPHEDSFLMVNSETGQTMAHMQLPLPYSRTGKALEVINNSTLLLIKGGDPGVLDIITIDRNNTSVLYRTVFFTSKQGQKGILLLNPTTQSWMFRILPDTFLRATPFKAVEQGQLQYAIIENKDFSDFANFLREPGQWMQVFPEEGRSPAIRVEGTDIHLTDSTKTSDGAASPTRVFNLYEAGPEVIAPSPKPITEPISRKTMPKITAANFSKLQGDEPGVVEIYCGSRSLGRFVLLFDGDKRICFLALSNGSLKARVISYDHEDVVQAMRQAALLDHRLNIAEQQLADFKLTSPHWFAVSEAGTSPGPVVINNGLVLRCSHQKGQSSDVMTSEFHMLEEIVVPPGQAMGELTIGAFKKLKGTEPGVLDLTVSESGHAGLTYRVVLFQGDTAGLGLLTCGQSMETAHELFYLFLNEASVPLVQKILEAAQGASHKLTLTPEESKLFNSLTHTSWFPLVDTRREGSRITIKGTNILINTGGSFLPQTAWKTHRLYRAPDPAPSAGVALTKVYPKPAEIAAKSLSVGSVNFDDPIERAYDAFQKYQPDFAHYDDKAASIDAQGLTMNVERRVVSYPTGTRYSLDDSDYQFEEPETLRSGGTVTLFYKGVPYTYTLGNPLKAGDKYKLVEAGEEVGEFSFSSRRLSFKIGKYFSITGTIPQRKEIQSLTISGNTDASLSSMLDALARRIDVPGWDDRLRYLASLHYAGPAIAHILSVYNATISFATGSWHLTVSRNDTTPDEVLVDFINAATEAKARLAYHPVTPQAMGTVAEPDLHNYPYHDDLVDYTFPDGSVVMVSLSSCVADARLSEMELTWNGSHQRPTNLTEDSWDWYNTQDRKMLTSHSLTWNGLQSSSSPRGVQVSRDYAMTLTRVLDKEKTSQSQEGAYKHSLTGFYYENRRYRLSSGETIHVKLKVEKPGEYTLEEASWSVGTKTTAFPLSEKRTYRWNEPLELAWQDRPHQYLDRRVYIASLSSVAGADDVSLNLVQVSELTLPVQKARLRATWQQKEAGQVLISSIDLIKDGTVINLKSHPSIVDQAWSSSFTVTTSIFPFGAIESQLSLSLAEKGWQASSNLQLGGFDQLQWIGVPQDGGYLFKGLAWVGDGRLQTTILPTTPLREGDVLRTRVRQGDQLLEYRLTCRAGQMVGTKLVEATVPGDFVRLTEEEKITMPAPLLGVRATRPRGESFLPVDLERARFAKDSRLAELIHSLSSDTVLYPTLDSMHRMMEVAERVDVARTSGAPLSDQARTVRIQLVANGVPLLFEQEFIYNTDLRDPLRWRPAGTEGLRQVLDHHAEWNGQKIQTLFYQMGPLTHQLVPVPPGTTRLYSLPLPGRGGFFVLHQVAGTNRAQLIRRQREAISGFRDYAHAQAAGLVELKERGLRYASAPQWDVDELGLAQVTLFSDEQEGAWISFNAITEGNQLSFEEGRAEISWGDASGVKLTGVFQGYRRGSGNDLIFVQMDPSPGADPKVFRASVLPGHKPCFVDIPYTSLSKLTATPDWLYEDGWVGSVFQMPGKAPSVYDPERDIGRYLFQQDRQTALTAKPVDIQGPLEAADKTLLPYLVNEQDWQDMQTILPDAVVGNKSAIVHLIDSWLSEGGSDFQLLPESIESFRKAQEELKALLEQYPLYQDRKQQIPSFHPIPLWLTNGHGVLMQVWIQPYQSSRSDALPIWVLDPNGRRGEPLNIRFVGTDPQTGKTVQVYVPSTYQRPTSSQQRLNLFAPFEGEGLVRTLDLMSYEGVASGPVDTLLKNDALFGFYDATSLKKDSSEVRWSSPQKRGRIARARLEDLYNRVGETEETFQIEGARQRVEEDGKTLYRWTLAERDAAGAKTGKYLQVEYPLPHLSEVGASSLDSIPIPMGNQMKVRYREEYKDAPDQWHETPFNVARGIGDTVVLVHPQNHRRRYVMEFETLPGHEGDPKVRMLRGFELGLDTFYAPPQWPMRVTFERARAATEALGGGRIQDVSGDYAERGQLQPGFHAYRYFFRPVHLTDAEICFDILLNAEGRIVRVLDDSWRVEGEDAFDSSIVKTEISQTSDGVSIYLRHLPPTFEEAKGQTHFFKVDLSPDPETHNFLGRNVSITNAYYKRVPGNPNQYLFPSEKTQGISLDRTESRHAGLDPASSLNLDMAPLDDWLTQFMTNYDQASVIHKALSQFNSSDVHHTAFGYVMLWGLRTYVASSATASSEEVGSVAQNMMQAALFVYERRREGLAQTFAESVIGLMLQDQTPWAVRAQVLEGLVSRSVYTQEQDRLQGYHDLSLVFDQIPQENLQRFIRILGKPNIGLPEKERLAQLRENHYDANENHQVRQWVQQNGVARWLDPVAPTSRSGSGGHGGGQGSHASLQASVRVVTSAKPTQRTTGVDALRSLVETYVFFSEHISFIYDQLANPDFVNNLTSDQVDALLNAANQGPDCLVGLWSGITGQTLAIEDVTPSVVPTQGDNQSDITFAPLVEGAGTLAVAV